MAAFSKTELSSAYESLHGRCLSQSALWVLDFITVSDLSTTMRPLRSDPTFMRARCHFRTGEFKRAVLDLTGRTDQASIGLRILSKFIDIQRGIEQNVSNPTSFLNLVPVSTASTCECFNDLIAECESHAPLDDLNTYIYAAILVKGGRHQDAIPHLTRSLRGFPLNRSAWRLLVGALVRFDDAVVAETLGSLPDHWTSLLFRIEFLAEMQQTEAALKLVPSLTCPRTPSVIAVEATVHYHHRDFDRAQALFEELRRIDPMRVESMELYSNLLFVKEDVAGLSELVQSLAKIDKFRPETLTVTGNFFAINEKHEEAIAQFAMALRFDASYGFAWTLIGHEFVELQNVPAAISAYTKACEANPRDFRALYGLGRAFEMSKMPYQAILYYRNAVTVNPGDSRIWIALAECYEEVAERENAITCYQRAVCNVDGDGIAIFRLAKLYRDRGEEECAAFCYENYAEKYVTDETSAMKEEAKEAILFLANHFRAKRDFDKAETYAQKLMFDPSAVGEGNALLRDIRSEMM